MAFTVTFYSHDKKENSTKQASGGTSYDCALKDSCSVVSPVIQVKLSLAANPSFWNYAHISLFGRFYFVREWTYDKGIWFAELEVDVLASYKSEIGAQEFYITRSSAEYSEKVIDTLYPTSYDIDFRTTLGSVLWKKTLGAGVYVVGIIGNDGNSVGAVSYHTFTQSQFTSLCSYLFDNPDWLNMSPDEISEELTQVMFNPFQYIVSCIWLPVDPFGVQYDGLKYGWWTLPVGCGRLGSDVTMNRSFTVSVEKHPQAATRGAYLNGAPYSRYDLSFYPFGVIPLDPAMMIDATTLTVNVVIDLITGAGRMWCQSDTSNMVYRFGSTSAQVGIPIQLAQIAVDYLGTAGSIIGSSADVAVKGASGDIGGAITSLFNGFGDAIKSAMPQVQTSGSNGSFSSLEQDGGSNSGGELRHRFYKLVDEDRERLGRPLAKKRTPASLGGYMVVDGGDLEASGTLEELSRIKGYLEGGFYYE